MEKIKIRTKQVDWEGEYKQAELWEKKPHEYSILAAQQISQGRVLDLGCGEGYDCLYFASKGYKVTGVDISQSAINHVNDEAEKNKVKINTIRGDIGELCLGGNYDLILSYGVLQFLGLDFDSYMNQLKEITKKQGIHSFYIFGNKGDFYNIAEHRFSFPSEEKIKKLYSNWDILKFETKNTELLMRGDNGEQLHNLMYKILARKS